MSAEVLKEGQLLIPNYYSKQCFGLKTIPFASDGDFTPGANGLIFVLPCSPQLWPCQLSSCQTPEYAHFSNQA